MIKKIAPERTLLALAMLGAVVASGVVLYLAMVPEGPGMTPDSRKYLNAGVSMAEGNGMAIYEEHFDTGQIQESITNYPPLTSAVYALLVTLGVEAAFAPAVLSLLMWPLLLSGMGLLAYRLGGGEADVPAATVVLGAMTAALLQTYGRVLSEVIFLPLLVGLMLLLTDLPRRERATKHMAGAALLLAVMLMTRYSTLFVGLAVGLWWLWVRLSQRRPDRLVPEFGVLSLSLTPLLLWMWRNVRVGGGPLGNSFTGTLHTFGEGTKSALYQTMAFVFPSVYPRQVQELIGPTAFLLYLVVVLAGAYMLWRRRGALLTKLSQPPRSPVPVFLVVYLALYTLAQPFIRFFPMDERDATSMLCIGIPWLMALFAVVPRHTRRPALAAHAALCAALLLGAVWQERGEATPDTRARTADLRTYHASAVEHLRSYRSDVTIVSNRPQYLAAYRVGRSAKLSGWLAHGSCSPERAVVVALFNSRIPLEEQRAAKQSVEEKCPEAPRRSFENSTIYYLGDSPTPLREQSTAETNIDESLPTG